MARTLLLNIDGSIETVDKEEGLEASQALVGGNIETILWDGSTWCLGGNEWGKMLADENSDFANNEIARNFVARMKECELEEIVRLHGPMFLIGVNDEGAYIDVPEEVESEVRLYEGMSNPDYFTKIQEPIVRSFSSIEEMMAYKERL